MYIGGFEVAEAGSRQVAQWSLQRREGNKKSRYKTCTVKFSLTRHLPATREPAAYVSKTLAAVFPETGKAAKLIYYA